MNCRKAAREAALGRVRQDLHFSLRKRARLRRVRCRGAQSPLKELFRHFFENLKNGNRSEITAVPFFEVFYCAERTVPSERLSRFTTGGATKTISTAVAAPEMTRTTRPPNT